MLVLAHLEHKQNILKATLNNIKTITIIKKNVLILISFLFINCSNDVKSSNNIINCTNSFINKSKYTNKYYENIKVLENDLIKNKLLRDKTKESYITMLDSLNRNPAAFKKFSNIDKYFHTVDVPIILHNFHSCVYQEMGKNRNSTNLRTLLQSIENMEMTELNIESTKMFVKAIDFSQEKLRLIACGYVEMSIFAKFNY